MMNLRNAVFVLVLSAFALVASAQSSSPQSMSEPTLFAPGVISTGDYEVCPQFSLDRKTFYFVKSTPDANFWTIVFSRLENGKWSALQVAPFSGQYSDADEFITHDGKQMFFISKRPLPKATSTEPRKLDIWVMDRTATSWGEPRNLGAPVNSDESEYFPTLTNDGTLYFGSRRAGAKGGVDLYRSRFVNDKYQEPENLVEGLRLLAIFETQVRKHIQKCKVKKLTIDI